MVFYGKPISLGLAKCEFFARIYHLGPVPPKALKSVPNFKDFDMIHSFFRFFFHCLDNYGRVSKLGITQKKPSLERVHCKTTTKGLFFRPLNLEDMNIGKPSKITESWDL